MAMALDSSIQRISRLTPLAAVLAAIERDVSAVAAQSRALDAALDATLAQDVTAAVLPPHAIALRDGYAVEAAAIADAGSYAPIALVSLPRQIDSGEALPQGTDSVAPLDAIVLRGERAEAVAAVTPGDGVLPTGGDTTDAPLRRAGQRLRRLDVAILRVAEMTNVSVRAPRVQLAFASASPSSLLDAALTLLTELIKKAGGAMGGEAIALDAALTDDKADAIIAVGGTGSGRHDSAVLTLAKHGRVAVHGIAVAPGETAGFGFAGKRPVLLIPGRLDAVMALWVLVGRPLLDKLAGREAEDRPVQLALKRKAISTIGLTEVVPVRIAGDMAEPLGSGYLSLSMLAESDGYIVVPADSEGFAAGAQIAVRSWP
jgi:molybdopterin molybdotransferase